MIYLIKTVNYQSYFWQADVREKNGKVVLWRRWGRMGSSGDKMEKINQGYEDAQFVFMDLADNPFCPWVDEEYLERRMKEIR